MTAEAASGGGPVFDIASLKRHSAIGIIGVIGLFAGLTAWAALTDIQGAVIAGGALAVEGFSKQVQHADGGIVTEILARNEDTVEEGQVLVRLDDTSIKASLAVVNAQRNEALIIEARVVAELAGAVDFALPAELEPMAEDGEIASRYLTQQQILTARVQDQTGKVSQLNEQISQLDHQIEGLDIQLTAANRQYDIIADRAADMEGLYAKNLVEAGQVAQLRLQLAAAEGEKGRLIAAVAQSRATIAETKLQIEQIKTEFTQRALDELQRTRQILAEATQQKVAAEDRLARTIIRSPQTGIVHESVVHTVGGVVGSGQVLMMVVPQSDDLLVGIHIDPMDIDQIQLGQRVHLRFSSLDQRKTPEAWGNIEKVSPDLVVEQQTGRRYYTANVRIEAEEKAKLPKDIKLLPGMPVEAFVTTGERSVLDYLIHPIVAELQLAFREP
ncbi:MAG: HlyD family type I secretion periplasmic adaptor subunit [Devosia sp.]